MSGIGLAAAGSARAFGLVDPINVENIEDSVSFGVTASAGFTWNSEGSITPDGNASAIGAVWLTQVFAGAGSPYHIKVTVTAGTSPGTGTVGSWLACSSNRQWTWTRVIVGTTTATITIEISDDAGATTLLSKTGIPVDLTVEP
jgi:hypothetical protein